MRTTTGLLASLVLGSTLLFAAPLALGPSGAFAAAADPEEKPGKGDGVTIVFRDGRTVEGTLIEETATGVKVLVNVAGISAETTYEKADILAVERNEKLDSAAGEEKEAAADPIKSKPKTPANPGAKTVYLLELEGGLGREVTKSPLQDVLKDVKKHQPDILLVKIDMDFRMFNFGEDERRDYDNYFDQFFACHEIAPILTDDIERDRSWTKKPKLVFWVDKALGGIAFLPFNSPHIYYTSDARQGGVGDLGYLFEGVGDKVVQEKQRSLRLGMAEGMAGRGGHNPIIIRAMTREEYVLSADFVGGKPVFYENSLRGSFLLTDDGDPQKGNADLPEDIVRGRGNDVLQLDAETAFRLGVSSGTADTIEELMSLEGIARNYVMLDTRAKHIMEDWAEGVDKAELQFRSVLRDLNRVEVQGDYQERTAARGTQIRYLKQLKSILARYGESIDPREIGDWPEGWDQDIDFLIQHIKSQQFADGPP